MDFVTKFPIIHWLFPAKVLQKAYFEIIQERGEDAYWYKPDIYKIKWSKLNVGIGINGVTFKSFIKLCKKVGFTNIHIIPTPLFSVGKRSRNNKTLKSISYFLKPLVKLPFLREVFSHRIVCILQK